MVKTAKNPADYILPLYMNGLSGRMLRMPPPKGRKREILFVYGHHASIERHFGVAALLGRYGGITIPDLPGFGGMDPFYKIGEKPTVDNMADYLAAFIKLRYSNKKITLAGYSLGFVYLTRMLQKYPEIVKKVDVVVSTAGFTHKSDFAFTKKRIWIYRTATRFFSNRLPAAFFKHIILRPIFIKLAYRYGYNSKHKFEAKADSELKKVLDMEVALWRDNDPRTYMATAVGMFTLDLTDKHVSLPVYHTTISDDHYFNHIRVEQHMRMIYKDFYLAKVTAPNHSPSVIATAADAAPFVPKEHRRLLNKKI